MRQGVCGRLHHSRRRFVGFRQRMVNGNGTYFSHLAHGKEARAPPADHGRASEYRRRPWSSRTWTARAFEWKVAKVSAILVNLKFLPIFTL